MIGFADIQAAAEKIKVTPRISLVTEYGIEKNGIRFPSRVVIQEAYLRNKDKKKRMFSEVTIDYKDYQFFTVEVGVDYK